MELLAPAGSREALLAALDAGADAVYMGLSSLNARQRAKNFSLHDLSVLCDYLHRRGKKAYLALNVLVKESELPEVRHILKNAAALEIDGVIIQDLGVLSILRQHFPGIPIHGSTQMAVHNHGGVSLLERLGLSRVILARELSLQEIRSIKGRTKLPLEVFVHGAMCFSVSGLCFASSVIGGCSGNRGLCTQPCRRLWHGAHRREYLFSMLDLQALGFINALKEIGIASVKIEGRMKGPDYVKKVVGAYRQAIDGMERAGEAIEDFAREKTDYFLTGRQGDAIKPGASGMAGIRAGVVKESDGETIRLMTEETIHSGDMARIAAGDDCEADLFQIKALAVQNVPVEKAGPRTLCTIQCRGKVPAGSVLYLAGRCVPAGYDKRLKEIYDSSRKRQGRAAPPRGGKGPGAAGRHAHASRRAKAPPLFLVKIDSSGWLPYVKDYDRLVVALDALSPEAMGAVAGKPPGPERIIVDLPPFISEGQISAVKRRVEELFRLGFRRFMLENLGHFGLLPRRGTELYGGPFLYGLNSEALAVLSRLGISAQCASYEDDYLNIKNRARSAGLQEIIALFARPPCFLTRVEQDTPPGAIVRSGPLEAALHRRGEIFVVVGVKPFSIMQHREKLALLSPYGFLVDLSFYEPSRDLWNSVRKAYLEGLPFPGSMKYNFKRELR
ncbi:MAG: U32 family peptidase [Candidatus Eremiobacteraeota bacterium]|nr:U32 family peptidase [Candidatus Eremiobacteraeota bacterium]